MCWAFVYSETVPAFSPLWQPGALLPLAACKSRDTARPATPRQSSPPSTASLKPPELRELLIFCIIPTQNPKFPTQWGGNSWNAKGVKCPKPFMIWKNHFLLVYIVRETTRMNGTKERALPSLPPPLSVLQFKGAAGSTKPLHVAHEISFIILQICWIFTRCCWSDQNSDAIYLKKEKKTHQTNE